MVRTCCCSTSPPAWTASSRSRRRSDCQENGIGRPLDPRLTACYLAIGRQRGVSLLAVRSGDAVEVTVLVLIYLVPILLADQVRVSIQERTVHHSVPVVPAQASI